MLHTILKPVNWSGNVLLEYKALNYGQDSKLLGGSKINLLSFWDRSSEYEEILVS